MITNKESLESFINFCNNMEIAEEGKKWNVNDKIRYKVFNTLLHSRLGLANQRMGVKNI